MLIVCKNAKLQAINGFTFAIQEQWTDFPVCEKNLQPGTFYCTSVAHGHTDTYAADLLAANL